MIVIYGLDQGQNVQEQSFPNRCAPIPRLANRNLIGLKLYSNHFLS